MLPRTGQAVQVVGVNCRSPSPLLRLFLRKPQVVNIMLVEEFGGAVGSSRPSERWNRIDDLGKVAFARPQRFFSALAVVDID